MSDFYVVDKRIGGGMHLDCLTDAEAKMLKLGSGVPEVLPGVCYCKDFRIVCPLPGHTEPDDEENDDDEEID